MCLLSVYVFTAQKAMCAVKTMFELLSASVFLCRETNAHVHIVASSFVPEMCGSQNLEIASVRKFLTKDIRPFTFAIGEKYWVRCQSVSALNTRSL